MQFKKYKKIFLVSIPLVVTTSIFGYFGITSNINNQSIKCTETTISPLADYQHDKQVKQEQFNEIKYTKYDYVNNLALNPNTNKKMIGSNGLMNIQNYSNNNILKAIYTPISEDGFIQTPIEFNIDFGGISGEYFTDIQATYFSAGTYDENINAFIVIVSCLVSNRWVSNVISISDDSNLKINIVNDGWVRTSNNYQGGEVKMTIPNEPNYQDYLELKLVPYFNLYQSSTTTKYLILPKTSKYTTQSFFNNEIKVNNNRESTNIFTSSFSINQDLKIQWLPDLLQSNEIKQYYINNNINAEMISLRPIIYRDESNPLLLLFLKANTSNNVNTFVLHQKSDSQPLIEQNVATFKLIVSNNTVEVSNELVNVTDGINSINQYNLMPYLDLVRLSASQAYETGIMVTYNYFSNASSQLINMSIGMNSNGSKIVNARASEIADLSFNLNSYFKFNINSYWLDYQNKKMYFYSPNFNQNNNIFRQYSIFSIDYSPFIDYTLPNSSSTPFKKINNFNSYYEQHFLSSTNLNNDPLNNPSNAHLDIIVAKQKIFYTNPNEVSLKTIQTFINQRSSYIDNNFGILKPSMKVNEITTPMIIEEIKQASSLILNNISASINQDYFASINELFNNNGLIIEKIPSNQTAGELKFKVKINKQLTKTFEVNNYEDYLVNNVNEQIITINGFASNETTLRTSIDINELKINNLNSNNYSLDVINSLNATSYQNLIMDKLNKNPSLIYAQNMPDVSITNGLKYFDDFSFSLNTPNQSIVQVNLRYLVVDPNNYEQCIYQDGIIYIEGFNINNTIQVKDTLNIVSLGDYKLNEYEVIPEIKQIIQTEIIKELPTIFENYPSTFLTTNTIETIDLSILEVDISNNWIIFNISLNNVYIDNSYLQSKPYQIKITGFNNELLETVPNNITTQQITEVVNDSNILAKIDQLYSKQFVDNYLRKYQASLEAIINANPNLFFTNPPTTNSQYPMVKESSTQCTIKGTSVIITGQFRQQLVSNENPFPNYQTMSFEINEFLNTTTNFIQPDLVAGNELFKLIYGANDNGFYIDWENDIENRILILQTYIDNNKSTFFSNSSVQEIKLTYVVNQSSESIFVTVNYTGYKLGIYTTNLESNFNIYLKPIPINAWSNQIWQEIQNNIYIDGSYITNKSRLNDIINTTLNNFIDQQIKLNNFPSSILPYSSFEIRIVDGSVNIENLSIGLNPNVILIGSHTYQNYQEIHVNKISSSSDLKLYLIIGGSVLGTVIIFSIILAIMLKKGKRGNKF